MKDPLTIQISNRTRLESGIEGGEWLKLPATAEQLHAAMKSVGITADNPQDFLINGIETPIDGVSRLSLGSMNTAGIDELNYLAARLETLDPFQIQKLHAAAEVMAYWDDVHHLAEYTHNTDFFVLIPDAFNHVQLGEYYLEKSGMIEMPDEWIGAINIEMLGQLAAAHEKGQFTEHGYILESGDEWKPVNEVPEQYRIMSYPQPEQPERGDTPQADTPASFGKDFSQVMKDFYRDYPPYSETVMMANTSPTYIAHQIEIGYPLELQRAFVALDNRPEYKEIADTFRKRLEAIPPTQREQAAPNVDYDAIATRAPAVATVKPPEQAQPQPVIPLVLNAEKPAEKLKEITDKLEQGIKDIFNSEPYKSYLNTMSKFYNYSINNTMLIAMQKPDATLIAGFKAWKSNFERSVKKGEKGIKIIAPSPFKMKKEMEKIDPATQKPVIGRDGKPVVEEVEVKIPAYKVVSVFDVSQTEGKELPTIGVDTLTGSVDKYKDFFAALEKTSTVPIGFEEIKTGANGYYHLEDKRIALQEGMSELQTLKTAIHEIAHSRLHDIDVNDTKDEQPRADKRTREVEAESIAYTVCQHYGLDTSDYSFGYVAGWSSDKELSELKASLETIRATAAELITEIDGHFAELQKTQDIEKTPVFDKLPPEQQQALSNEVQATLQIFIDSDIKTHGEVTESTLEAITVQGYEYKNGELAKATVPEQQPGHEEWSEPATAENAPENPGLPSDDISAYLPEQGDTYSIYQLKHDDSTRDIRFEPLDRLQSSGLALDPANYELVYTAPITADTGSLGQIFEKFNIDRPEDFKGHSLSISDVVTLNQDGQETAHYVDRYGFKEVPQFLQPVPERPPFDMQHTADYLQKLHNDVMKADPNKTMGVAAYNAAVKRLNRLSDTIPDTHPQLIALVNHAAESTDLSMLKERMTTVYNEFIQPTNYLETAEKSTEQSYNMIDGIMNNTPTVAELEAKVKAGETINLLDLANAVKTEKPAPTRDTGKKPSIRKQLAEGKAQLAKDKPAPDKAKTHNNDLEV